MIDNRIVNAEFNNKQFEKGVGQTINSLDNLKKGLQLDGAARGLNELQNVGSRFNLSGIADSVSAISSRFTNLGIIGVTTLQNLTNSAVNFGKRMISALTIDPVKTGFEEYELKMNSIKTILANTKAGGTTLDDVNKALNEMNEYSDQTIYNFAQMTDMVSKFSATSGDLDSSVNIVKGMANLAAEAGVENAKLQSALYQTSQAMSGSYFQKMDWNSLENAGIATKKFREDLVKMGEEMGVFDGMGDTLAGLKDETIGFGQTLEKGWLTTDVFAAVTEVYAMDEAMTAAAGEVTTFTKLFDVMKEAVQSGWSISWESIIGDKNQSTELLTNIKDGFEQLIGPSAEARNEMLSFWNANGGRDALIKALSNALKTLSNILGPISEAWYDLFPRKTGEELVAWTLRFEELTETFKIGEDTMDKISRAATGLFSILDMGKQIALALAKPLLSLFKKLTGYSGGILDFAAEVGDFFTDLNTSAEKADFFNNTVNNIIQTVKDFASKLKFNVKDVRKSIGSFTDSFQEIKLADLSGLSEISEKFEERFAPISKLAEGTGIVIMGIANVLKKVGPKVFEFASLIAEGFKKLYNTITEQFVNADFDTVFDLLNSGLLVGITLGIKKFIDSFSDITESATGILDGVTGILDGVRGSLEAYQTNIKASALLKIAGAVAMLAGAVYVLSTIDSEKLSSALSAISIMFMELFAALTVFTLISSKSGVGAMTKVSLGMLALSTAVLILSEAVRKLSELSWEELSIGLVGVGVILAELAAFMKVADFGNVGIKGSLGLIALATALLILSEAVSSFAELEWEELAKGMSAVTLLLAELAIFTKATANAQGVISTATGLFILGGALILISKAVVSLADLEWMEIARGLTAMTGALAVIAGTMRVMPDNLITTGGGLLVVAISLKILASALTTLGGMDPEEVGIGLFALTGALTAIAIAANLMPPNLLVTSAGLLVMSIALVALSKALETMGGMTWDEIGRGLAVLAGSLVILGVAMYAMTASIAGAAALLVVAVALRILAPALEALGSMSWEEIGRGLVALAGALAIIGIAGALLTPVVPTLLGLGIGIALLGVGLLAAGAGLLLFSTALAALAVSGAAGAAALVVVVSSLLGLIPMAFKSIGEGIIMFANVIKDGMPALVEALTVVIGGLVKAIVDNIPVIVDGLMVLLTELGKTILEYGPDLLDMGYDMILMFLEGIANNIDDAVQVAIKIGVNFLNGISAMLPDVIQAGVDLILSFINGLAQAIEDNTDDMIAAMERLFDALMDAAIAVITAADGKFDEAGEAIMKKFRDAIDNMKEKVKNAVRDVVKAALNKAKNFKQDFTNAGKDLITGFANGIKEKIEEGVGAVKDLGGDVLRALKKKLDENSPSREGHDIGAYLTEGVINGLLSLGRKLKGAATDVGDTLLSTLDDATTTDDYAPVITPVIDMSNITSLENFFKRFRFNRLLLEDGAFDINTIADLNVNNDNSGIRDLLQRLIDKNDKQEIDLTGEMTVKVVNDKGEIVSITETAIRDLLRRESR